MDARWVVADCSREASLQYLCQETLQRMGDVDMLLNFGGDPQDQPSTDLRCYELPARVLAGAILLAQGRGCILNLITLTTAQALCAPHPLAALTHALASRWAGQIRINTLCLQLVTRPPAGQATVPDRHTVDGLVRWCLHYASAAGRQGTGQWRVVAESLPDTTGTQQ